MPTNEREPRNLDRRPEREDVRRPGDRRRAPSVPAPTDDLRRGAFSASGRGRRKRERSAEYASPQLREALRDAFRERLDAGEDPRLAYSRVTVAAPAIHGHNLDASARLRREALAVVLAERAEARRRDVLTARAERDRLLKGGEAA